MALRSGFGDILEPGLHKIFDDKYNELGEVFPSLFHVESSTQDEEKDSAVSGFGYLQATGEGEAIQYEDPFQMYDVSYRHLKYTKGFKVSEELYEDDLYNVINKKPAALARSARRTREYYAASVFNNAFSSGTGGDGKYLCSIIHPRADGVTTQSNASASGIAFTEPNLETGLLAMRAVTDDKGMKIMSKADILLVPPDLEKEANIVINSKLRPGSYNNDYNYYEGMLKVVPYDYLTSTTAWFLIDSGIHELYWFNRVLPEFKQDNSFDTGMALYKTRTRFSKGWSDWRGVWGSKGDAGNYAS